MQSRELFADEFKEASAKKDTAKPSIMVEEFDTARTKTELKSKDIYATDFELSSKHDH